MIVVGGFQLSFHETGYLSKMMREYEKGHRIDLIVSFFEIAAIACKMLFL